MKSDDYQILQPTLPELPGVYRFIDKSQTVIYVGKAKNLKKRIGSYFNKNHQQNKTEVMVKTATHLEFTIVDSEKDALLLENTLIKKLRPRYNVSLKDDKTYPYLCIKNENFPRVFVTRKVVNDGSEYFGPYTSFNQIRVILDFVKQMFQTRNCNLNLTPKNIAQNKFKVCLEYHLGNCNGPCANHEKETDYALTIDSIRNILNGNLIQVEKDLENQMNFFSAEYQFEKAELTRQKILSLNNYSSHSTVVNPTINNIDVFSFVEDEKHAYVNFIKVLNGSIIQTKTFEAIKKVDEDKQELLQYLIFEIRNQMQSNSTEIIVPFEVEFPFSDNVIITVPKKGDKKKLLELSEKNVLYYRSLHLNEGDAPKTSSERILNTVQKDFRLQSLPFHIECFDNSNFQGSYPVASVVVFKNAKPSKKDYRHFNIKTVEGPNDFASMEEIVLRRYKRLTEEGQSLPNLIIIDGGKGQLSAAYKSLTKLELAGKMTVVGIAKKLEEIYFPDDSLPLYINKKSESLKLIQQIRNEAHRFAITFHRNQRSKGTLKTELTAISGIGKQTSELLLKHFRSVDKIKMTGIEEIESVVGKAKAQIVFNHFQNPDQH